MTPLGRFIEDTKVSKAEVEGKGLPKVSEVLLVGWRTVLVSQVGINGRFLVEGQIYD